MFTLIVYLLKWYPQLKYLHEISLQISMDGNLVQYLTSLIELRSVQFSGSLNFTGNHMYTFTAMCSRALQILNAVNTKTYRDGKANK